VTYCIKLLALVSSVLFGLAGCSSTPTELVVAEDEWAYEIGAINMLIRSATDVNTVNGRPHSIVIGIFQMDNPNTFISLAVNQEVPDGAFELLKKGRVDDSIVSFQLIPMQPGEQKNISISRAQKAKYIGVIAGYYKLNSKTDVKIFEIPVQAVKRGSIEKTLSKIKLIRDEGKALPGKLNILVDLGRTESKEIVVLGGETW
jgi:type VI secretion system VasD/TssJ family lipoprotein